MHAIWQSTVRKAAWLALCAVFGLVFSWGEVAGAARDDDGTGPACLDIVPGPELDHSGATAALTTPNPDLNAPVAIKVSAVVHLAASACPDATYTLQVWRSKTGFEPSAAADFEDAETGASGTRLEFEVTAFDTDDVVCVRAITKKGGAGDTSGACEEISANPLSGGTSGWK